MASRYYDPSGKEVYDGDVAYASDINTINSAINTGFELVQEELDGDAAETWAGKAQAWASQAEDSVVEGGKYSALHYAEKAADSASTASGAASSAVSADSSATTQAGIAVVAKNLAVDAQDAAETYADTAEAWASKAEDSVVEDGKYSALHYAAKASDSASAAETAETNAETARDYANEWATKAEDSQVNDGVNPAGYSAYHWAQKAEDFASNSPYPIDTLQAKGSVSGAVSCDVSSYDTFTMTITGATTLTFSNIATGRTFTLVITNGGSNITWPEDVKWPGGTEPALSSSGVDRVVLQQVASSNVQASLAGQAYA